MAQEGGSQPVVAQVLQEVLPGPTAALPAPGRAAQEGSRPRSNSQSRLAPQAQAASPQGQGTAPRTPRASAPPVQQVHLLPSSLMLTDKSTESHAASHVLDKFSPKLNKHRCNAEIETWQVLLSGKICRHSR